VKIAVEADEDEAVHKAVIDGLVAFNREAAGLERGKKLVIAVRDDDGAVVGGVCGRVAADSAYLDLVYLDASLRGTGIGRAMMQAAENEARRLGAGHAWLYTMSFQARPFYEKLGYKSVGEMPFMGGKHRYYFMSKDL
jgi:GNAT superfamily N-acetyltransferase